MKSPLKPKKAKIYIALETGESDPEKLHSLTATVMRWSEDVWILDMSGFYGYWQSRASASNSTAVALWRGMLGRVFGETMDLEPTKVADLSPAYRAACASHPWISVLMLYAMMERNVRGLILEKSRFGRTLLEELSWDVWWKGEEVIGNHFDKAKVRGFKPAPFRKRSRRLKQAAVRLGLNRPDAMKILNYSGMKRRFGVEAARLWGWMYGEKNPEEVSPGQTGFPWREYRFGDPPVVNRCLDYPLISWEQLVPFLNEDLDKLAGSLRVSGEHVNRIDWRVVLENMLELQIPICFRNPHDLEREKGNHLTTILQAKYAFESAMREAFPPESSNEEIYATPSVLNWELQLTATLVIPNVFYDIFGEAQEKETDNEILRRVENELPVNLDRFYLQKDWLPEDSYAIEDETSVAAFGWESESDRSLNAVAEERPLYIRRKPLPLKKMDSSQAGQFLESTMDKWWKNSTAPILERHYFKHIDPDGNAVWIFQDSTGNWYQHGIFG